MALSPPAAKASPMWFTTYRRSHFAPAFFFLSKERRRALQTLYAVCRVIDDTADDGMADARERLEGWRLVFRDRQSASVAPFGQAALAQAMLEVADRWGVPLAALLDLIDKGVGLDLGRNRFRTAMDVESYCYGVAGTVGIACLPIFGVPVEAGRLYAIRLGIAIQWINLIRDLAVDAKVGRIYLPLDHLEQFGYTESDLLSGRENDSFFELIRHEALTARRHFSRADELFPGRYRRELLPARIMARIYLSLLDKVERHDFPVLKERVRLNAVEKAIATFKEIRH